VVELPVVVLVVELVVLGVTVADYCNVRLIWYEFV
jgi:hypothetical protein